MTQNQSIDAMTKIVEVLTPLPSDDRLRIIRAALALLGEAEVTGISSSDGRGTGTENLPQRAQTWMKQNSVARADLEQIFHFDDGMVEIIAAHMTGRNKKEQTHNAYVLAGIGQLLLMGSPSFDDKSARALCERAGCYDSANHATYIKDRGNIFTGSKERGWTLTSPGLKRGAEIVKDINKLNA